MVNFSFIFISLWFFLGTAYSADVTVKFAHAVTGGSQAEALNEIVNDFEKRNPGIKIKQIVQDDDIYEDAGLITLLKSKNPPDIYFQWGGALVARDAKEGHAANLTAYLSQGGWKKSFSPAAWAESSGTMIGNDIYMIPTSLDVTTVLWYNKKIFKKLGLKKPKTWDDLMQIISKLRKAGITPIVMGNNELWPFGNWAGHIAWRAVDPALMDAALRQKESFNQPAFLKVFELYEQLGKAGAFNKDMAALDADPAMAGFFAENAAMHAIGSWLVSSESELADEGFEYDSFNTPVIDPNHPSPNSVIGLSTGYIMSSKSKHKDAAVKFLKHFTSMESQIKWAESGAFSPVKGVMQKANIDSHTKAVADMFQNADSIVPPPDTGYPVAVADAFYQAAAYVAGGVKTPEEALIWLDNQVAGIK